MFDGRCVLVRKKGVDLGPIPAADNLELTCAAFAAFCFYSDGSVRQVLCLESVHRRLSWHPALAAIDLVCAAGFLVPLVQPLKESAEIATVDVVFLESRKTF